MISVILKSSEKHRKKRRLLPLTSIESSIHNYCQRIIHKDDFASNACLLPLIFNTNFDPFDHIYFVIISNGAKLWNFLFSWCFYIRYIRQTLYWKQKNFFFFKSEKFRISFPQTTQDLLICLDFIRPSGMSTCALKEIINFKSTKVWHQLSISHIEKLSHLFHYTNQARCLHINFIIWTVTI